MNIYNIVLISLFATKLIKAEIRRSLEKDLDCFFFSFFSSFIESNIWRKRKLKDHVKWNLEHLLMVSQ